jgi:hypothetical protein
VAGRGQIPGSEFGLQFCRAGASGDLAGVVSVIRGRSL